VIIVLGSRHDDVATDLVASWTGATLCSADDLVRPGWLWPARDEDGPATWVVDGTVVDDAEVTGVFVRRATVYAEELIATHPDDRAYLAAEAHAMLVYALHRSGATVVNPVSDGGALGEAALRPEHWIAVAASVGVEAEPLVLRSTRRSRQVPTGTLVEVVGGEPIGEVRGARAEASATICDALGLAWAVVAFDRHRRIGAITTRSRPSAAAAARLADVLGTRRS
jgi:hypothetical protein